jgi:hypothetical protein
LTLLKTSFYKNYLLIFSFTCLFILHPYGHHPPICCIAATTPLRVSSPNGRLHRFNRYLKILVWAGRGVVDSEKLALNSFEDVSTVVGRAAVTTNFYRSIWGNQILPLLAIQVSNATFFVFRAATGIALSVSH